MKLPPTKARIAIIFSFFFFSFLFPRIILADPTATPVPVQVVLTPTPDLIKETETFENANRRLLPRSVQEEIVAREGECNGGIKVLGICLFGSAKANLARQTQDFQPVFVNQEKVVNEKNCTWFGCDLLKTLENIFTVVVPKQLEEKETGALNTYRPGSLSFLEEEEEPQTTKTQASPETKVKTSYNFTLKMLLPRALGEDIVVNPTVTPLPSGAIPTPIISGGQTPTPTPSYSGTCSLGSGYCSVDYLRKSLPDTAASEIASRICQKESGSNPFVVNKGCLTGRSLDYSIGLFQINLLAHCGTNVFSYTRDPVSCKVLDPVQAQRCENNLLNPEININKMVELSENGTNWNPWAAYRACNFDAIPTPTPSSDLCSGGGNPVNVPGTTVKLLDNRKSCIKPEIIVIHWSGSWTSAQVTFDVLNSRGLSCQLATDGTTTLQMLNFFQDRVEGADCVGGEDSSGRSYNDYALNIEISGVYFDEVIDNPLHPLYNDLKQKSDKAVSLTCFLLKQYNISKSQIYGHYELLAGKSDPGVSYLQYFKNRVATECN